MDEDTTTVENEAYGAFAKRIVRSLGKRAAAGDCHDLRILRSVRTELVLAELVAMRGLRAQGYSLTEIGAGLGISKQAVWNALDRDAHPTLGDLITES